MSGVSNAAFDAEVERNPDKNSLQIPLQPKGIESYGIEDNGVLENQNEEDDKLPARNADFLSSARNAVERIASENTEAIRIIWIVLLNAAVFVYFGFATRHWYVQYGYFTGQWCEGYGMLVILLAIIYGGLIYYQVIKKYFANSIAGFFRPFGQCCGRLGRIKLIKRFGASIFYLLVLAGVIVFMIIDTADSRDRLISFFGAWVLMTLGWLFSKHPAHINWHPVIWGLILQFAFGVFTIRWSVGRAIFQCIADKVTTFLNYTLEGALFVFSEQLVTTYGVFAFASLPVIFFFSFIVQILYYIGAMQWFVMKVGGLLQYVMGTTVCESINSVANIFLSMSESPLLIKPYIPSLTSSEIHTVMASGFATVSGTVLIAYINFGAEAAHLITASVMSAPASLCFSKLFWPETEKSRTSADNIQFKKSEDSSILDAASKGAITGIPIYLGIIANVVAFVSFVAFLNGLVSWLGVLVGYEDISFEWLLTKIFMPLSWIMGVPWKECEHVATLIGLKTAVNEFVAYQRLGEYKELGLLSSRTEAIATYAICGFSNPGSIGIMIGSLTSMAPEKRTQIAKVAIRAFLSGSAVCFLTACVAGMLMTDEFYASVSSNNSTIS